MRGSWRVWSVVVLLAVLHFLLHLGVGMETSAPDLLTVALLVAARKVGVGTGAGLGLLFGLMEDAFSLLAFGANAVAMTVLGGLGAGTRDLFVGDSVLFLISYLFLGKWTRDLIHWLLVGEGVREPFVQAMLVDGAIAAAYATAVGLVAMAVSGAWWETLK